MVSNRFHEELPAERIGCLTVETVETLYLMGEEDCIVGTDDVRRPCPTSSPFHGARGRCERIRSFNAPEWQGMPAVAANRIHEIKSPLILQPGPAALTDGLDAIVQTIQAWRDRI